MLRPDLALKWKFRRTGRSRLIAHVKNHADGSQVRETLISTGNDQVFRFAPEDAQKLLNELYSKNLEKFTMDIRLDGTILTLRYVNRLFL